MHMTQHKFSISNDKLVKMLDEYDLPHSMNLVEAEDYFIDILEIDIIDGNELLETVLHSIIDSGFISEYVAGRYVLNRKD